MALRSKIILSLLAIMAAYMILNYQIQKKIISPNFAELERTEAEKDIKRCVEALQREIYHLDSLCRDWAAWDDSCEFVADKNKDYIDANLVPESFTANALNIIYIIDKNRKIVWGEVRDLTTEELLTVKEFYSDWFEPSDHPFFVHEDNNSDYLEKATVKGIYMTESGPVMVASRPIITSKYEGPVRGWIVMGRFLNTNVIEMLKKQTGVNFKIWSVGQDTLPDDEEAVLHQIVKENKYYIKEQNDDKLHVYTTVPDINGNTELLLKAVVKRDITSKGQETVHFAMLSITVVGALILVALLLLLNRLIVKPLGKLTFQMKKIGPPMATSKSPTCGRVKIPHPQAAERV